MKTFQTFFYIIMFVTVVAFTGCSKDDNGGGGDDDGGGGGDEYFTAKIDGTNFSADMNYADLIQAHLESGILTAQGSNNAGDAINFSIIDFDGEGTYKTGDELMNMNLIQYVKVSPFGGWVSSGVIAPLGLEPGEIKITKINDTYVEGTFRFVGYNSSDETTKTVTEGKFKANF